MVVGLTEVVGLTGAVVVGAGEVVGAEVGVVAALVRGVGRVVAVVVGLDTSAFKLTPGGTSSLSMACNNTPFDVETSGPVTVASLINTLPLPTTTLSAEPSEDFSCEVLNWFSITFCGITL